ncbi:glycoside hydrolase family 2 TIM barrel-domain containing protein [Bdellovibrio sp. 22V]|uniref:glycoside hydrolase family 2 TIM barrel-domain containing protein n=1 Tax=Bdellovibrio TaxID=958 RepID=UPI002542BAAB|nr:glycoside hydrolase family 2 TIM barrel-domain containing protein [Bdellovibrio sp. 22V]WII71496.1 glycoside hydrolase family 2 TIM barrel-domain containing protein [Bdellovibrio sp. 22V]
MLSISETNFENYPRKNFQRKHWLNLNGLWSFSYDDDQIFSHPSQIQDWPHKIVVPYAPESPASGIGDTGFHTRYWYQRKFQLKRTENKVLLHFGAADYQTHVWVNSQYLGSHEGGYTPFHFEISDFLSDSGEQVVSVLVEDDPLDLQKPRGKQDWQKEPHSIWYHRTSGIWQTVWCEEVAHVYIEKLRLVPLIERWEIGCEAFIGGPNISGLQLKVRMECDGKLLVQDTYEVVHREVHRRIALSDPGIDDFRNEMLWSPEKPTLIQVHLELWKENELLDEVKSYTALRSVGFNRDRFLLNGRPYYLRLVLDQGYWPDTFLTPPNSAALRKDVELVKAAGFNGVRKHQKIEDPNFYYWADVLGLVVWAEMPSAYRFTHDSVERLLKEWTEVIDRDMSHPSIILWVPFNESWGVPDLAEKESHQHCVQALYHLTKTLDPTRPCIGNDGWESTATDLLGIHDYDDQPERLIKKYGSHENIADMLTRYRPGGRVITVEGYPHGGKPIMITEFGGIAYVDKPEGTTWGYSASGTIQDLRKRYENLLAAIYRIETFCGFCYTQFTDTFQEANGLFRPDRTPKFSVNAMARATRGGGYTRGELTSVPQPPPLPPPESEL